MVWRRVGIILIVRNLQHRAFNTVTAKFVILTIFLFWECACLLDADCGSLCMAALRLSTLTPFITGGLSDANFKTASLLIHNL